GGVSLETITAARFLGQQPAAKKGPGSTATEATSRSSSQDTQENENNAWQQQPFRGRDNNNNHSSLRMNAGKQFYSTNRISLKEAQEWDFCKKLDELAASERRGRERSFSEPRLSSMARPAATNNDGSHDKHQECQCGCHRGGGGGGGGDACAGLVEGIQRTWSWLLAGGREEEEEEEQNPGIGSLRSKSSNRVNSVCRNYASCTSTKTFEVSPRDRKALAKLGVVPETGFRGVGAPASMTFTMHVAGYRVVSTILGMHAEYEVCVKGGGRRWSKWQRFSKFKMIAACTQGDPDAASAWTQVLQAKPHYRCLNPDYLAVKCNLLEVFLQQVLFAMPTPALLIHFVSQRK
ncbi:unnamed protein product, partial [Hapterophycus canaliculatus]